MNNKPEEIKFDKEPLRRELIERILDDDKNVVSRIIEIMTQQGNID